MMEKGGWIKEEEEEEEEVECGWFPTMRGYRGTNM